MKRMKAKYAGMCRGCGGEIKVGDSIKWGKAEGAHHESCAPSGDPEADREYLAGRAAGNRRAAEVAIYGSELVEQWEMEAEMRGIDF